MLFWNYTTDSWFLFCQICLVNYSKLASGDYKNKLYIGKEIWRSERLRKNWIDTMQQVLDGIGLTWKLGRGTTAHCQQRKSALKCDATCLQHWLNQGPWKKTYTVIAVELMLAGFSTSHKGITVSKLGLNDNTVYQKLLMCDQTD